MRILAFIVADIATPARVTLNGHMFTIRDAFTSISSRTTAHATGPGELSQRTGTIVTFAWAPQNSFRSISRLPVDRRLKTRSVIEGP